MVYYLIFGLILAFQLAHGQDPFVTSAPQASRPPQVSRPYRLCTFSQDAYKKCQYTVRTAKRTRVDLGLSCVRNATQSDCLEAVRQNAADIVVLKQHGYREARKANLKPVLFERDSDRSLYIAVAPRDIKLIDLYSAPISVNQSDHRAFHAAVFFNSKRGHDICRFFNPANENVRIKIVDSAKYQPNYREILICPDLTWAAGEDYRNCNFEMSLQYAVFMNSTAASDVIQDVKRTVFDRILRHFSAKQKTGGFNFFSDFNGSANVILNNDAVAFDLNPTYRNKVDEKLFNELHCDDEQQRHEPSQLE